MTEEEWVSPEEGMNRAALEILLSGFCSPKWKDSVFRSTNAPVRWLPILSLKDNGYFLGIASSSLWVAETADKLVPLTPDGWLVPILVCLERTQAQVTNHLTAGLETLGLPARLARTFPFDELIMFALTVSEYWAAHAVTWIEEGLINTAFASPLSALASADKRTATQSLRNRALQLVRKIDRCACAKLPSPITLNPAWQTPIVVSLAQSIYDERAFDRLPILADALEEAGCTNDEILKHCRSGGEHVRGCWVVDLVLGKE